MSGATVWSCLARYLRPLSCADTVLRLGVVVDDEETRRDLTRDVRVPVLPAKLSRSRSLSHVTPSSQFNLKLALRLNLLSRPLDTCQCLVYPSID